MRSSLELDDLWSLEINMSILSIFLIQIEIFELVLQFSDIHSSESFLLLYPLTILIQKVLMTVAFLYLEFEPLVLLFPLLDLLFSLQLRLTCSLFRLFDSLSEILVVDQSLGKLLLLLLKLVVIFKVLRQKGYGELRFLMKDLRESFSQNVGNLRLGFEVLDFVFHLSYIYNENS
jgi:hypothetical protein